MTIFLYFVSLGLIFSCTSTIEEEFADDWKKFRNADRSECHLLELPLKNSRAISDLFHFGDSARGHFLVSRMGTSGSKEIIHFPSSGYSVDKKYEPVVIPITSNERLIGTYGVEKFYSLKSRGDESIITIRSILENTNDERIILQGLVGIDDITVHMVSDNFKFITGYTDGLVLIRVDSNKSMNIESVGMSYETSLVTDSGIILHSLAEDTIKFKKFGRKGDPEEYSFKFKSRSIEAKAFMLDADGEVLAAFVIQQEGSLDPGIAFFSFDLSKRVATSLGKFDLGSNYKGKPLFFVKDGRYHVLVETFLADQSLIRIYTRNDDASYGQRVYQGVNHPSRVLALLDTNQNLTTLMSVGPRDSRNNYICSIEF